MRVVIGNQYYSTLVGSSVSVSRSVSDPVPTCTLNIVDVNSSLNPQPLQEIIIIDDQVYSNPTQNIFLGPDMNPYTSNWLVGTTGAVAGTQITGGGVKFTFTSAASGANGTLQPSAASGPALYAGAFNVVVGATYCASYTISGAPATNVEAIFTFNWTNNVGTVHTDTSTIALSAGPTRLSFAAVAPSGAQFLTVTLTIQATASSNNSVISVTQAQLEIEWVPTISYPTPWCGPSQTNCQQLPLGFWIRQYRKFAGFITHVQPQDYHGNVRTLVISAVGYAWLMGTFLANDTFTSKTDAQIITTLLGKYLLFTAPNGTIAMLTTTNVVTGITVSSQQCNWNDLRSIFDNLCGMSGFYWTVDFYWNFIYAPPGYLSQGIGLICDNSSTPDNVTTFPAYNFSAEQDFTQPGSTILVLGNGSNVAEVVDPSQTQQLGYLTGYWLPPGTSWMRKVSDSTLASVTDCTTRGQQELLLYDFARKIYHLTTNQELIPGESIQLTSATEGLSAATLLIQQVTANWIGTNETLDDYWEYKADLGATNRAVVNMISRIFRATQAGTSAPAISTTTQAVVEPPINIVEAIATTSVSSNYLTTLQADGPVAVYALNEITGTIADDTSGNAYQGALNGGITQGTTGLLVDAADSSKTAWTFNGSTGYASLPTGLIPTGSGHAWSLEAWIKINSLPGLNAYMAIVAIGANANQQSAQIKLHNNAGTQHFMCSTFNGDIEAGTPATGTTYHIVGTYDGTSTRLYVNNSLIAGPTAFTVSLGTAYASIGADGASGSVIDFFNGVIQYAAIYNVALSSTQISNHYHAGGF